MARVLRRPGSRVATTADGGLRSRQEHAGARDLTPSATRRISATTPTATDIATKARAVASGIASRRTRSSPCNSSAVGRMPSSTREWGSTIGPSRRSPPTRSRAETGWHRSGRAGSRPAKGTTTAFRRPDSALPGSRPDSASTRGRTTSLCRRARFRWRWSGAKSAWTATPGLR